MKYYDEKDDRPRLYGGVAVAIYAIAVAALLLLIYIPITVVEVPEMMVIEFEEVEPPTPQPVISNEAPRHERISTTVQNSQQVSGTDAQTQTINRRAMFQSNSDGVDEPEDLGNPYAQQGEENLAQGDGGGLNPIGNDQLDEGLRGRGLVGNLPVPSYPGNASGKIVIRVAVDQHGQVTSAAYEPKGSTSSDAALIAAAIEAAKRARFTESRSFAQGGTITYNFRLN
ncbi:MAG: energy transducer TonB [Alistipes sp.]|nr:energy transducer TonB [Alistipes sp.]MBQ8552570.1 energy transducer TonB [Alistipes sp.]MBR3774866.1 energy transducer TonB [Alistipes sp.]MBR3887178.1 energy transducer TonB [Alistipes sp.]